MHKILIVTNSDIGLYKFRKELIFRLSDIYDVHIISPNNGYIVKLKYNNVKIIEYQLDRHGINPIKEIKLLLFFKQLLNQIKPSVVLSYTIKPNLYMGLLTRKKRIVFIPNITGLGNAIQTKTLISKFINIVYKISLKKSYRVMVQNESNLKYLLEKKIINNNYELLFGSGVNLQEFNVLPYPVNNSKITIAYFGRVMKSKGIVELLEASLLINRNIIEIIIIGEIEDKFEIPLSIMKTKYNIKFLTFIDDIKPILLNVDAVINPSHHEGMSNILLEAAASGRPLLASNIHGCKEIVIDDYNGYLFQPNDVQSIVQTIEKFCNLDSSKRLNMGLNSRHIVEKKFNRDNIVNKYIDTINKSLEGKNESLSTNN